MKRRCTHGRSPVACFAVELSSSLHLALASWELAAAVADCWVLHAPQCDAPGATVWRRRRSRLMAGGGSSPETGKRWRTLCTARVCAAGIARGRGLVFGDRRVVVAHLLRGRLHEGAGAHCRRGSHQPRLHMMWSGGVEDLLTTVARPWRSSCERACCGGCVGLREKRGSRGVVGRIGTIVSNKPNVSVKSIRIIVDLFFYGYSEDTYLGRIGHVSISDTYRIRDTRLNCRVL